MAAYPSFRQLIGTRVIDIDGQAVSRATSGKPKIRNWFSQKWRSFKVLHNLDATDKNTLMTFYDTEKGNTVDFTFDGDSVVYTCRFSGPPQIGEISNGRWPISVSLIVV